MTDKDKAEVFFNDGMAEFVGQNYEKSIETFANENNIWRSQHLKLEETGDLTDVMDR